MDATYYRRRARQCLEQANLTATLEAKTRMLDLAATYLRFAEWLEGKQQSEKIHERGESVSGTLRLERR
jgi:hypothetical protein